MRTFVAKPAETQATRKWWVVDAKDKSLGRLASEVAKILRGKHKVIFTPHVDTGDFVIVINAEQVKVTGNKADGKIYYRHSGYVGGMKSRSFSELVALKPTAPVEIAVKGMLPKNALGRKMIKKLKVYAGAEHPHVAQTPEQLSF
jgi:large subunit ribosomal protein L13